MRKLLGFFLLLPIAALILSLLGRLLYMAIALQDMGAMILLAVLLAMLMAARGMALLDE
jgi:hypothetical protein